MTSATTDCHARATAARRRLAFTVAVALLAAACGSSDATNSTAPIAAASGALGSGSGGATTTSPGGGAGTSVGGGSQNGSGGSGQVGAGGSGPQPSRSASGSPAIGSSQTSRFGGYLLIADRQNGRLLIVNDAGQILWRFPVAGSLPPGQRFSADDAFISPDGKTITANEEGHQVVVRIDIASAKIVWEYGQYDRPGHRPGELHTPDDAYPLANGDITVADIENCRVLEISPDKRIVRQWGHTKVCKDNPPADYARPNGATPLPDGGVLITEITGSRVVRLDAQGNVLFDIHVPVRYPSDAQLDSNGNVLVVDYSNPGQILRVSPTGKVLWRYGVAHGAGRLDHPSLAIDLTNGTIALNDDFRHRVIVIDPRTKRIVWQYGHTDRPGRAEGYLFTPDGIDVIPPGTPL